MAFGHVCVGISVVGVAVHLARSECKRLESSLDGYPTYRHCALLGPETEILGRIFIARIFTVNEAPGSSKNPAKDFC